ncbi:DUF4148 domain-containing protein [Achromobacter pestifer]|uniref:DUF4148 domain-containing protein n=1 Tax=Achromobacter pestifer TaxID=1353889 RepID=A0A6S6ZJR0_9BURK|nr:DUF4148 domain-containing protein [Achromobacter pestifer]CAB3627560.1 hypothetical protein LMG3431_00565 [Achromobacter pestifer]
MKTRIAATVALTALIGMPALASANNVWHQTDTEIGYAIAPEHATAGKSREQVVAELAEAKSDKRQWFLTYRNLQKPAWAKQGTSRTRADVLAEAEAVTPAERARLADIYTPG